jgi:hypothetical protein
MRACTSKVDCGDVSHDGFRVTADGSQGEVEYRAQANIGPFTALHAGNDRVLASGDCSDWNPEHAELALVRKPLKH